MWNGKIHSGKHLEIWKYEDTSGRNTTMDIKELLDYLEKEIPANYACSWDNSGLQVGHAGKEVKKVYIALDATEQVVGDAAMKHCDFILTHHPLLFSSIKQVTGDTSIGRKLYMLIGNDIACYSAHTNFDAMPGGMGELAGMLLQLRCVAPMEDMSGHLEDPWGIGVVGNLPEPRTLGEFCDQVKQVFSLKQVSLFAAGPLDRPVQRIAVCPGSGRSMVDAAVKAQADVFLTGDMGHHEGIDCMDMGISVIDAGHFGLEKIFVPVMAEKLSQAFPELEIYTAKPAAPFQVY
jgi:dinuclear metal center YbgI/SA1388 family protein